MILSAQRAWHDVYFIPTPDKLELLAQYSTVTDSVCHEILDRASKIEFRQKMFVVASQSRKPTSYQPHMFELVKARRAILSMPGDLQIFGHYMYGPFVDDVLEQLQELVWLVVYNEFFVGWRDDESAMDAGGLYLITCFVRLLCADWRHTSFGRVSKYARPQNKGQFKSKRSYSIGKMCADLEQLGVYVKPCNWPRQCEPIYERVQEVIQRFHNDALGRVYDAIMGGEC